ncbi:MAG TPA: amino acid ABC transporter substrate-binding protein [Syntrophobacteraceae bacterium]|nr:amino acid ABC transporter substrate-binding protein [Syntrophobacteraceae bacterium]
MFRKTEIQITTIIFFLLLASIAEAKTVLRIAYPAFPPFHWVKENGEMAGFFYEIITEALEKRMGMTVVWTEYPWPRCQENIKLGIDDAIITVPTNERADYTVTTKAPFYSKPLNIFTYIDHPRMADIINIRNLTDLRDKNFSVITYIGNGWHKENIQPLGIKTYEASILVSIWKMLAERRGDVVIEWPPGSWPDIQRAGVSDRITDTNITISSMPFHLLLRKSYPKQDILDEFNQTISNMNQDGTMSLILSKFY